MAIVLSCDCGHQWHAELPSSGAQASCPVCGSEVAAPPTDQPTATYLADSVPAVITARAEPGVGMPRVPGYEILGELGRGGMGIVYKARQSQLDRTVALKVIRGGRVASADELQRFQLEAEAAAQLDHPHIVPVYEVGAADGQHYFSMGYVAGESLQEKLRGGPLPPREAAALVQTIAGAVHFAHQKGIVHRDLKPANVLIDGKGQPRITDFGLAKRSETDASLTATGQVLGTPSYMPPEQAAGRLAAVGPRSDVYALGGMLYSLLTGRPPFQAASLMETLKLVLEEEPVAPRQLNRGVPRDLETICLKCLEKETARRYATAAELADDLGRYLDDRPISARPVGGVERGWRWCRRNPSGTATIAAVLLLVVGGFSVALWYMQDRGERVAEGLRREAETATRVARLEQEIESALGEVDQLGTKAATLAQRPEEWGAVLATAVSHQERAEALLAQESARIDPALRDQAVRRREALDADIRDHRFASAVEGIQLEITGPRAEGVKIDKGFAYSRTLTALAEYGLDPARDAVDAAKGRIAARSKSMQTIVLGAIDMCMRNAPDASTESATQRWLMRFVEAADDDPWRRAVRNAIVQRDRAALMEHVDGVDVTTQPVSFLIHAANALYHLGAEEVQLRLLAAVRETNPDDFWANLAYCSAAFVNSELEDATAAAWAMIALRPDIASGWNCLGDCLRQQGDDSGAESAYRKAIEVEPDDARAQTGLADALFKVGDARGAGVAARRAVELQPDDPDLHAILAIALAQSGDARGAVKVCVEALTRWPDHDELRTAYGSSLGLLTEGDDALTALRKARDLLPEDATISRLLGRELQEAGDVSGAATQLRKAVELQPGVSDAHFDLAVVLALTGDVAGAATEYREVIRLEPEAPDAHTNLGMLLYETDRLQEAIELFRKAVALVPNDPEAHVRLGVALVAAGDHAGGIAAYRKAIELQPEYALAHKNLGRALELAGDPAGAAAAYRKSAELQSDDVE